MTIELVTGGVGLIVIGATWLSHRRQQATIERLEDRLAHLTAGVALLTDTTEGGLRDIAVEIGRMAGMSSAPKPRSRAATQRRVSSASRRGRSVQEIAAAEQVSEGEINLHLQLQQAGKDAHAALR
jgi:hypothetical protein